MRRVQPPRAASAATVLLALLVLPASAPTHLRYMTMYGLEPAVQHGWLNLGMTVQGNASVVLATKAHAWAAYRIPSLYDLSLHLTNDRCRRSGNCSMLQRGLFNDTQKGHGWPVGRTLNPWWAALLEDVAKNGILPAYGGSNMYRGVFLGDELCGCAACWATLLAPLSAKLR